MTLTPPLPWHLLPAIDAGDGNCWLLANHSLPSWVEGVLQRSIQLYYSYDEDLDAWSIESKGVGIARCSLERQSETPLVWCSSCRRATACSAWDVDQLLEEGYRPRRAPRTSSPAQWIRTAEKDAAKVLGLAWPATTKEIQTAFSRRVHQTHPDAGGSEVDFQQVVEARNLLLASISDSSL